MKVAKPFGYSLNGLETKQALRGPLPDDVPSHYIPDLIAEGYIVPDGGLETGAAPALETGAPVGGQTVEPAGATPLPLNWRDLNADDTKALASSLTGDTYPTKADAVDAIEDYLES